jgi:hypothetical protein
MKLTTDLLVKRLRMLADRPPLPHISSWLGA